MTRGAKLMLCLMALPLMSCSATGGGDYCLIYKPVFVSDQDRLTDATARQVLENNLVWRRICK